LDSDPDTRTGAEPTGDAGALERLRDAASRNALWIQIAIGVIAWVALMLAYPLQSTTPIYAGF
jgi:hypothetical protein